MFSVLLVAGISFFGQTDMNETGKDRGTVFQELRSPSLETRKEAASALVGLASTEEGDRAIRNSLDLLTKIIADKQEDPEVRGQTVRAIAIVAERNPLEQADIPVFVGLLRDEKENELVRSWVATALPDLAPREIAGPALLAATRSSNLAVRVNAAQQIGRLELDPQNILRWLEHAMKDRHVPMRLAALAAASELWRRDQRALPVLLRALRDKAPQVRNTAILTLTQPVTADTDKQQVRRNLEPLLSDPDPDVRMAAAAGLLKLEPKHQPYIDILIGGLQADDAKVREAAAKAMVIHDTRVDAAVPALQAALNDQDRVKVHAAIALTRITGEQEPYLSALRELAGSEDEEVRMWAIIFRGLLGGKRAPEGKSSNEKKGTSGSSTREN